MRDKSLGIITALVIIAVLILWGATDGFRPDTITIGSVELSGQRSGDVVTLIQATSFESLVVNNFDSMDSPRGTSYQVPAGKTLYVYLINWTPNASSTTLWFGYGDNHVENSTTTPTNAVALFTSTGQVSGEPINASTLLAVPEGKYPAITFQDGAGAAPSGVMAYGLER